MAGVKVDVSGVSAFKAALSNVFDKIEGELNDAVEAEAEAVVADARTHVRRDSGDLADSITAEVNGLVANVRPRSSASSEDAATHAIKANVNEFGRKGDAGHPYMVPAAEASRARWPKRAKDAVRKATS